MKTLLTLTLLTSLVVADEATSKQYSGVEITYKEHELVVKRAINPACEHLNISTENLFGDNLAGKSVPSSCKKYIIAPLSAIQPIRIDNDIETVGELEVLDFLEALEFEPDNYALIDARESHWYEQMTIPNAINIPYYDIEDDEDLYGEYTRALKLLHVKRDKKGILDFSTAKDVIVFCNASWCVQSAWAIRSLVKMGYPKNK
ncbi:MAG TPA: rhodanese-like domain-containing protein [Arcobacter sp.]|nr:rhodanese-like domain-containing protein [Arcobacter sp.]